MLSDSSRSGEFTLRPATSADKGAILSLINLIQPNIPWTSDDYDWQLVKGPAGPAEIRVIECSGKIVSLYVGTRKNLWVDGEVRLGLMVQDVLTDPEYRGRGFLNRLAQSFLMEIRAWGACGYTFPNKLSENSFRRCGWSELTRIPALQKAVSDSADPSSGDRILIHEVPAFDGDTGTIWRDAGLKIGVLRDNAYLSWRYARPRTTYRRFWINDGAGFFILKRFDRGDLHIMHVCDFVLRIGSREIGPRILSRIDHLAREAGANLLTAWVTEGHPYRQMFDAAGFVRDEANDRFAFVTGQEDIKSRLTAPAAWHVSQGDSDIY